MFSFGLCQVVQGAKEGEGGRHLQGRGWLLASTVPGLLREPCLRGFWFLGGISTGLVPVQQEDVC